jgi:hypothetical protein
MPPAELYVGGAQLSIRTSEIIQMHLQLPHRPRRGDYAASVMAARIRTGRVPVRMIGSAERLEPEVEVVVLVNADIACQRKIGVPRAGLEPHISAYVRRRNSIGATNVTSPD